MRPAPVVEFQIGYAIFPSGGYISGRLQTPLTRILGFHKVCRALMAPQEVDLSLEDRILNGLAMELDIPLEELRLEEDISMETLPEWDSLKHSAIILHLEKEFGRSFDVVQAGQATSLEALTALILDN